MEQQFKLGLQIQQLPLATENWYDMKTAAKIIDLGFGRTTLFRLLRSLGFLMENNEPYQSFIDAGLFKVTLKDVYKRNGSLLFRPAVTLISEKGIAICKAKILDCGNNKGVDY